MAEAKYMIRIGIDDKDVDKSIRNFEKKMSKTMPNMELGTKDLDESIKNLSKEIKESYKGLGLDVVTLGTGIGTSISNVITKDLGSSIGKIIPEQKDISKENKMLHDAFADLSNYAKRIDEPFDDYEYKDPANAFWAETTDKNKIMDSVTEDEKLVENMNNSIKNQTNNQNTMLAKLTEIGKSVLPVAGIAATIGIISKSLIESSGYLKGSLDIMSKSFSLAFKPLGDFIGAILLPFAVAGLRFFSNFIKNEHFAKATQSALRGEYGDAAGHFILGGAEEAYKRQVEFNEALENFVNDIDWNKIKQGLIDFGNSINNLFPSAHATNLSIIDLLSVLDMLNGKINNSAAELTLYGNVISFDSIKTKLEELKQKVESLNYNDLNLDAAAPDNLYERLRSRIVDPVNRAILGLEEIDSGGAEQNLAQTSTNTQNWFDNYGNMISGWNFNSSWDIMTPINLWVNTVGKSMSTLDLPSVWNLGDYIKNWFEGERDKSGIDDKKSGIYTDKVIEPEPAPQSTQIIEPPTDEKTVKDILDNAQSMYNIHGGGKATLPNTTIEGGSKPRDLNQDKMIDVFTEPTQTLSKIDFELQKVWKHLNTLPFGHNPEAYDAALDQNPIFGQFITSKMTIGSSIEKLERMLEELSVTEHGREQIENIFDNNPMLKYFAGDQLPKDMVNGIRETSTNTQNSAMSLAEIRRLLSTTTQTPTTINNYYYGDNDEDYLRGTQLA